ncbi:hypothetical protein ACE3MZ_07160 [Paenibacillus sp. WLX1005]|uniref:hypothetical protein n=1 Tax=Paenibacillus sp. WLX1005 TaxID=3243766 RepID=UPI003983E78A
MDFNKPNPEFTPGQNPNYPPDSNYPPGGYNPRAGVLSVKDWMITLLLLAIPVVNIVMLFVWAFGNSAPLSKSNYAKATLLWAAIWIVLYIIFFAIFGAAFFATMSRMDQGGY